MLQSFIAFHYNALNNIIYMFTNNLFLLILVFACFATSFLMMKEEVRVAVNERQDII